MPSTKDAVFFSQQPDSAAPDSKAQSSTAAPAAAVAAAGKTAKGSGVSQPAKPATPQRSLDGLDEAVIKSVKALCQVCNFAADYILNVKMKYIVNSEEHFHL